MSVPSGAYYMKKLAGAQLPAVQSSSVSSNKNTKAKREGK